MCFNKVSIKHPNVCIETKNELVCTFSFLGKTSVASLEIKKRLQNATGRTLPYCKFKVIFKTPSKFVYHFSNMCFLKNSALVSFIVLSVITATLFIAAKQFLHHIGSEHIGFSHLTNKHLKMLRINYFRLPDLWL